MKDILIGISILIIAFTLILQGNAIEDLQNQKQTYQSNCGLVEVSTNKCLDGKYEFGVSYE